MQFNYTFMFFSLHLKGVILKSLNILKRRSYKNGRYIHRSRTREEMTRINCQT